MMAVLPLPWLQVYDGLVRHCPSSVDDCVAWARNTFEDLFHNTIEQVAGSDGPGGRRFSGFVALVAVQHSMQLLFNFAPDSVTSSGELFWSGTKRPPTAIVFDADEEGHMAFLRFHLCACVYLRV